MSEIYTGKEERKVIRYDIHDGYEYAIISLGHHPCAYVFVSKNNKLYGQNIEDTWNDVVHGGITYAENELKPICTKECEKWILGWDYAHYGDYTTLGQTFIKNIGDDEGKKYTIDEIMEDVYSMIAEVKKYE